jgi:hypothetical protein
MSLYAVQKAIYLLKKDKVLQESFRQRGVSAFDGLTFTEAEAAALSGRDLAALYRMGVHPLLCAPYARMMGIPRPKYVELLTPLRGLRLLKS